MSGGTFGDIKYKLEYCIESIEIHLEQNKTKKLYENKEVVKNLKQGLKTIKKAKIYVNAIDYLFAGDFGEESFLKHLKDERNKNI